MPEPATIPTRALVLGPSRLEIAGVATDLTRIQRRLVARLAATPGQVVGLAELSAALWEDEPPATARAAIHNQVSRLRSLAGQEVIETVADGYRLAVPTDAEDLRAAVRAAELALGTDPQGALALAERASGLAAGAPFADLLPPALAAERHREVATLLDVAADLEVEAALALGLTGRALPAARGPAADAPYDEARALRLARALAQSGRRGEALTEIARVRRALRTELGLDGSAALDATEAEIRGAILTAEVSTPPAELADVLAAVDAGRAVAVSGDVAAAVTRLLAAARDALLARGTALVAGVEVRGYRDVAVAALLDLMDLLGLETVPELGPVGTFVPAVEELAARRPVVLIVDAFDDAGPSTRRVLLEVADRPGVALVAGFRGASGGAAAEGFDTTIRLAGHGAGAGEARHAALRRRFAGLPREIRETLTAAAIAGDGVSTAVLHELAADAGLPGALARDLLTPGPAGTIAFADAELRGLVLADTPTGVREELHHALGLVLVARGAIEDAARHLLAASGIEPAAAVRAARAAAAAATGAGAHHDAAAWLRRAADCCRDERTRILTTIELGDALRLAGDASHVAVLREAAEQAMRRDDEELLGESVFALLQLGGTTASTSVDGAVQQLLDRTLARLRDPRRIAVVRGAASLAYSQTGFAARSRSLFLAAERDATDHETRRRVLPFAYLGLGLPADLDRRRELAGELLALGGEHDDPVALYEGLHLAASVHFQDADGAAVRRMHREMTALVDRVGDVGRRWALHYLAAAIAHLEGDGARTEQLAGAAFAQFAPVSESRATAVLFGQLFGLRLSQGRTAELAPALETLVTQQPAPPWNAALAVGIADTEPDRALALAREAVEHAEPDFSWLAAQLVAARAVALAVRRGADDRGLLERCREQLEPSSGRVCWQGTCAYGPVDTTLALLADVSGDAALSRALADGARDQAERLGAPVFLDELRALGLSPGTP